MLTVSIQHSAFVANVDVCRSVSSENSIHGIWQLQTANKLIDGNVWTGECLQPDLRIPRTGDDAYRRSIRHFCVGGLPYSIHVAELEMRLQNRTR